VSGFLAPWSPARSPLLPAGSRSGSRVFSLSGQRLGFRFSRWLPVRIPAFLNQRSPRRSRLSHWCPAPFPASSLSGHLLGFRFSRWFPGSVFRLPRSAVTGSVFRFSRWFPVRLPASSFSGHRLVSHSSRWFPVRFPVSSLSGRRLGSRFSRWSRVRFPASSFGGHRLGFRFYRWLPARFLASSLPCHWPVFRLSRWSPVRFPANSLSGYRLGVRFSRRSPVRFPANSLGGYRLGVRFSRWSPTSVSSSSLDGGRHLSGLRLSRWAPARLQFSLSVASDSISASLTDSRFNVRLLPQRLPIRFSSTVVVSGSTSGPPRSGNPVSPEFVMASSSSVPVIRHSSPPPLRVVASRRSGSHPGRHLATQTFNPGATYFSQGHFARGPFLPPIGEAEVALPPSQESFTSNRRQSKRSPYGFSW
jgi:hypothetical protein